MELTRSSWTLAALAVIACGGGAVVAQQMAERASASVQRNQPGQAEGGEAVLARLHVPEGFTVSVFASGLEAPRMMAVAMDGTVYVTSREAGTVTALRDADGNGVAEETTLFADQLPGVHGIDQRNGNLYLASSATIWVTPTSAANPQPLVTGLPDGGQHPNRMLRFGPDDLLYVSIGSSCNDCAEENQLERATLIRYSADGQSREVVANGLRNTIGYDWHPQTGALWGMDHGSDFRGDELPPEELNEIEAGSNYGWPICYGERAVDPMTQARPRDMALQPGQSRPSLQDLTREQYCAQTEPAVLTAAAHSAPMALQFYRGTQFPPEYRGDAFVALRGSWNRGDPVGYKVVRVRYSSDGRPLAIDDFLSGFLNDERTRHFARPVGLALAADGALLVSDDENGVIYRVAYSVP
jgi:glucose/arabinose dehydrogenase